MFRRVKDWLLKSSGGQPSPRVFQEAEIATAALLVEAALMDGHFDEQERETVTQLLARRFTLPAADARNLLAAAETRHGKADAVFKFALEARNAFSEEEREGLLEMLWATILSDGTVHMFEDNLMRRIAGLLHVPDRAAGEARKRAAAKAAAEAHRARGDGV